MSELREMPGVPRLVGVYRPRPCPPGFGLLVFVADGKTFVRSRSLVDGNFVMSECDFRVEQLRPAPAALDTFGTEDETVYAFEFPSGDMLIGSRAGLAGALRERVGELTDHVFVQAEVARFLGDEQLVAEAERRCQSLLGPFASRSRGADTTHSLQITAGLEQAIDVGRREAATFDAIMSSVLWMQTILVTIVAIFSVFAVVKLSQRPPADSRVSDVMAIASVLLSALMVGGIELFRRRIGLMRARWRKQVEHMESLFSRKER